MGLICHKRAQWGLIEWKRTFHYEIHLSVQYLEGFDNKPLNLKTKFFK